MRTIIFNIEIFKIENISKYNIRFARSLEKKRGSVFTIVSVSRYDLFGMHRFDN